MSDYILRDELRRKGWAEAAIDGYELAIARDKRLREIYHEQNGVHDLVLQQVAMEFNCSKQAAYMMTEFLYRPENMN